MIEIKNDLFNISKRIKKIDKNYFIVFSPRKKVYEVHYKNQKGSSLAFCVDKKYLNSEVLTKAYKTSVRNYKKLLSEIESNNLKLDKKNEEYLKQKSEYYLKSYLYYADKKGGDCKFENADNTLWV